jgi:molybdenum cofactor guanylyltransferase
MSVHALILAGGGGERLGGVRKADLRLGNRSLISRVASRLAGQCDDIVVSLPVDGQLRPLPFAATVLRDDPGGLRGPVAGLARMVAHIGESQPDALIVSVAVDTPFFPEDFVKRALPMLAPGVGCVVSAYGGDVYPTNAVWRVAELERALGGLTEAEKSPSLRRICAACGAVALDYGLNSAFNPFANINTLADLLALSHRLAAQTDI